MIESDAIRVLNLGSGRDHIEGAINLDIAAASEPHVIADLNHSLPFPDNTFDAVYCKDVIEHVENIVKVMEEIHRILRPSARLHITTPHYSCSNSYEDPTHRWHLGFFSMDMFCDENAKTFFTKASFKKIHSTLVFQPKRKNMLARRIARRNPRFYEEHLAWIFPAWFMMFELEALKPPK
ncbi:MAG TPA: class I SAM-dependent methyltransferase [Blastocatellia bacterium]|jgi:ubiquinone/menaquinone biosynthesis C-methylase UbiE